MTVFDGLLFCGLVSTKTHLHTRHLRLLKQCPHSSSALLSLPSFPPSLLPSFPPSLLPSFPPSPNCRENEEDPDCGGTLNPSFTAQSSHSGSSQDDVFDESPSEKREQDVKLRYDGQAVVA